jgi:hypothetical protein
MGVSDTSPPDRGAYCREIEAYLCRRNGGHLVRIVGPAFDLVSGWHARGLPLKVVYQGIDRWLQRHEQRRPRRRPARIEFCEADVLDAYDAWRRALGPLAAWSERQAADGTAAVAESSDSPEWEAARGPSLPVHVRRAALRLSSLLATSRLPPELEDPVQRIATMLERIHAAARTARGERRQALLAELRAAHEDLEASAWTAADESTRQTLLTEAAHELAAFRTRMPDDRWQAAVLAAARRLQHGRLGLPTLALE